jgi:transposase
VASCSETTAKGTPCTREAVADGRCKQHSGTGKAQGRPLKVERKLIVPDGKGGKIETTVGERIVQLLRAGNYKEIAARAAGVGTSTLYRWLETGEADHEHDRDTPLREFWDAVEKAQAEAEATDLALIAKAARSGQWQAAAWRLERKFPDRWGRREKHTHEVAGPNGEPMDFTVAIGDPETRKRAHDLVEQLARPPRHQRDGESES